MNVFTHLSRMDLPTLISRITLSNFRGVDQTPHYVVSDLDLHCLHTSYQKDTRLILVKEGS